MLYSHSGKISLKTKHTKKNLNIHLPHAGMLSRFSHIGLFATLWTLALEAPLSMGILQARILEWVALPFSRGFSQPKDQTCIYWGSCIALSH